jgi:hypothetical protein
MQPNRRLAVTIIVAVVWGLVPLLYFLPLDSLPKWAEHGIFVICFPGCIAAYILLGGVHSGYMDAFPVFAAIFTAIFVFAAIRFVFWLRTKLRRA